MGDSYRHHHASRDGPIVVLVPVPVAGSPAPLYRVKPPAYKRNSREQWRPATRPPTKAERVIEFIRRVQKQDNEVREMMRRAGAST